MEIMESWKISWNYPVAWNSPSSFSQRKSHHAKRCGGSTPIRGPPRGPRVIADGRTDLSTISRCIEHWWVWSLLRAIQTLLAQGLPLANWFLFLWLWKTSWMPHEFPVGQRLFCHGTVVIRVQSLLENFAQSWPAAHSGGCTRKVFCCACRHESGRTWHLATSRWSVGCSNVAQWRVTFLQPMLGSMAIENHPFGDGSKPWYLLFTPSHSWDLWMWITHYSNGIYRYWPIPI